MLRMKALSIALAATYSALGYSTAQASGDIAPPHLLVQVRLNVSTADDVERILGKPSTIMRFPSRRTYTLVYESHEGIHETHGTLKVYISINEEGKVVDIWKYAPSL